MTWYTGNLKPDLEVTLTTEDGTAPDLSGATSVKITGSRDGNTADFTHTVAPSNIEIVGTKTVLTMPWVAGDLAEPGCIKLHVLITWPADDPETVPVFEPAEVEPSFAAA